MIEATYAPDDNKIRLRSVQRFPADIYARLIKAGYKWAPKQDFFVAPMWTPEREDLALELAGEIGDEDTTLAERAEARADRFEDYSEKRAEESVAVRKHVDTIANGIPLGQPILVGHHSERHARKDAERIENGMRKAIRLWETSSYWTDRAKGAIRHAKYKERPAVRHRRIKGLEADQRKHTKDRATSDKFLHGWLVVGQHIDAGNEAKAREVALTLANFDHLSVQETDRTYRSSVWSMLDEGRMTPAEAKEHGVRAHEKGIARHDRWLKHIENRLAYERAMLDESGGIAAAKFDLQVGGQVFTGREWKIVAGLNRQDDRIVSVSVVGKHYGGALPIEQVRDYRPPAEGDAEKVTKATKLAPLVNYPGEGFLEMTAAEWKKTTRFSDTAGCGRAQATATHGAYRYRHIYRGGEVRSVYLTDAKRVDRPALPPPAQLPEVALPPIREPRPMPVLRTPPEIEVMQAVLKEGVRVVSAPDLFPTPRELAARVVALADVADMTVLEPSAGTGVLADEAMDRGCKLVFCVEVNAECCAVLERRGHIHVQGDFMAWAPALGETFDRVIMNPPFGDQRDIDHVLRAFEFLSPGGRLVAIMSAGASFRQDRKAVAFREVVDAHGSMEKLPDGSFKSAGTNVATVLVVLDKPRAS